jgi:GT2 family glycosyltransferase
MKISYAITVYNEYKELDNLLFHLSKHIREEDEVVVTQDISKKGTGDIAPIPPVFKPVSPSPIFL